MSSGARWRFESTDVAICLRAAADDLERLLAARGVSARARYNARLVTEEIVLNVFEHGGATYVILEAGSEAEPLRMEFEDDGAEYDVAPPPKRPHAPEVSAVNERGRGLELVRAATRSLEHRREPGRNRLIAVLAD